MSVALPAPELRYLTLQTALEVHGRDLAALNESEMEQIVENVKIQYQLHSLILSSPQAANTLISEAQLESSLNAIRERYPSQEEFISDLARNGLNVDLLKASLRRILHADNVLVSVGHGIEPVTDSEVRAFYAKYQQRFNTPETRSARQILITINNNYAENTREQAQKRIEAIASELGARPKPEQFSQLAVKHSECPTAAEQGKLGQIPVGKLYPELDKALFELETGTISSVLESELGFHLLFCEQIHPAEKLTLEQVRDKISQSLGQQRSKQLQAAWIRSLTGQNQ
ncbi:nitrogen fixation protein NifM [Candidatus Albibeggiatoa sp. nov. BB20]|uniref:nitrogen fixation protein NifM n=1 Tax=Candidatus Albibeggiatoa sp. nov. BB20 TaxID=3162723 RepID=UPI00336598E1